MAKSWTAMSDQSLRAAQLLLGEGLYRSSITRSYYSAYCAITKRLCDTGATFARGWQNPSHDQMPALVPNCSAIPRIQRWRINRLIRLLRVAREDADYRPHVEVDQALSLSCLHGAMSIRTLLEARDE